MRFVGPRLGGSSSGLAEEDADRAADILREALAGGRAMTRAECVAALEAAGIPSAGQRAYHLLWYASQKGVTCVGPQRGKEQTFVLLDDFAPPGPDLDRPSCPGRDRRALRAQPRSRQRTRPGPMG